MNGKKPIKASYSIKYIKDLKLRKQNIIRKHTKKTLLIYCLGQMEKYKRNIKV